MSAPDWNALAERALRGEAPSKEEALEVLRSPDGELLGLLGAAYRVRHHFHGRRVKVHILENAMSGMCPEDCHFCSQSSIATGEIERYRLETREEMVEAARKAKEAGAWKYCIVTSTRGPNERQLDVVCQAVREIKEKIGIRVCTSLGILERDQARRLKEAGVDRFNHNLESSARHFPEICSTHSYEDRVRTIQYVHEAGMESCSGGIVGMGEGDVDLVDLAFELRRLGVTSIPINLLNARPGTPLEGQPMPDPKYCLKVLCMVRFVNPSRDLRCAGGREVVLRSLQPLVLYPCNSIFTNGYLTTPGNADDQDARMIRDMGFELARE
ncbi:MAG TPA: biotin synthase BioB [Planctomycetota bacterium]|nr:biotin synthase BioB [Planctomycetota bacterium]